MGLAYKTSTGTVSVADGGWGWGVVSNRGRLPQAPKCKGLQTVMNSFICAP